MYSQPLKSYEIYHYGILKRSGRYPWGSGDRPYQRLEQQRKRKPNILTESPLNRVIRLDNEREVKNKVRSSELNSKMDKTLISRGLKVLKDWLQGEFTILSMAAKGTYVVVGKDEQGEYVQFIRR